MCIYFIFFIYFYFFLQQSLKVRHGSRESMSSGLSLYDELSSMDEMVEDTRSLSPNSTSDDEKIPVSPNIQQLLLWIQLLSPILLFDFFLW